MVACLGSMLPEATPGQPPVHRWVLPMSPIVGLSKRSCVSSSYPGTAQTYFCTSSFTFLDGRMASFILVKMPFFSAFGLSRILLLEVSFFTFFIGLTGFFVTLGTFLTSFFFSDAFF